MPLRVPAEFSVDELLRMQKLVREKQDEIGRPMSQDMELLHLSVRLNNLLNWAGQSTLALSRNG